MNAISSSSFFLVVVLVTLSCVLAQCPPQATVPGDTTVPSGQQQTSRSMYINHTIAEKSSTGLIKDAIISAVGNGVGCNDIVITGLTGEFGDGITWGTIVDFVINSASSSAVASAYDGAVALPLVNTMSTAFRSKFPAGGNSITAINSADVSSFYINNIALKNNQKGIIVNGLNGNSSGIAAQPCQVSQWSDCDGCARDKTQIVTRTVTKPAVGGGSCPALQMRMYCNRKCLTDWQIGLIALACFLFLVLCCICCYCVCVRRRRGDDAAKQRAQQKEKELATPPEDEKIDVEVVDPVRPSTATAEDPEFHRASNDTVTTGPRPTATFHDDDEPAETKPAPVPEEEAKSSEPEPEPTPVPVAATGAPRANVVRVHL